MVACALSASFKRFPEASELYSKKTSDPRVFRMPRKIGKCQQRTPCGEAGRMSTPFDKVIEHIATVGYHNHRLEGHSDIVSNGIVVDLLRNCEPFRKDFELGVIGTW